MATSYSHDVVAWAKEQAHLLRTGQFNLLDIEHLADEIEDVAKAEQSELLNKVSALICSLLSCPDPIQQNWLLRVRKQRAGVNRQIRNAQSLRDSLADAEWWADVWDSAVVMAIKEQKQSQATFPDICPWTSDQILDPNFIPRGVGQ